MFSILSDGLVYLGVEFRAHMVTLTLEGRVCHLKFPPVTSEDSEVSTSLPTLVLCN
jgi:hypothetical protein